MNATCFPDSCSWCLPMCSGLPDCSTCAMPDFPSCTFTIRQMYCSFMILPIMTEIRPPSFWCRQECLSAEAFYSMPPAGCTESRPRMRLPMPPFFLFCIPEREKRHMRRSRHKKTFRSRRPTSSAWLPSPWCMPASHCMILEITRRLPLPMTWFRDSLWNWISARRRLPPCLTTSRPGMEETSHWKET